MSTYDSSPYKPLRLPKFEPVGTADIRLANLDIKVNWLMKRIKSLEERLNGDHSE